MRDDAYDHGSHLPERDRFRPALDTFVLTAMLFAVACMIGMALFI